jgi:hypothetical protein
VTLKRILSGLTVIAIGVILLANTTGALPWTVWLNILMLWPLLLVAAGIDVIGRSLDNGLLRALGSVIILVGLAWGALAGTDGVPQLAAPFTITGPSVHFAFSEPHDGSITTGKAHVSGGLGVLTLKEGGQLATASGETPFGRPKLDVQRDGNSATVEIGTSGDGGIRFGPSPHSTLDVTLDPFVLWQSLKVDSGMSKATLDLSRLHVRAAEVDAGMSNIDLTVGRPWEGNEQVTVKAGMSNILVRLPAGVVSEVRVSNGLGSTQVGGAWQRGSDDVWRTTGGGEPQLRLEVDAGLSSVRVEEYQAPESRVGPSEALEGIDLSL